MLTGIQASKSFQTVITLHACIVFFVAIWPFMSLSKKLFFFVNFQDNCLLIPDRPLVWWWKGRILQLDLVANWQLHVWSVSSNFHSMLNTCYTMHIRSILRPHRTNFRQAKKCTHGKDRVRPGDGTNLSLAKKGWAQHHREQAASVMQPNTQQCLPCRRRRLWWCEAKWQG